MVQFVLLPLLPFLFCARADQVAKRFHNAVAGTAITNSLVTGTDQISFGRGAIGHVAMNYESTAWTVTLATDVPDGSCKTVSSL